jgi:hypothetical protein
MLAGGVEQGGQHAKRVTGREPGTENAGPSGYGNPEGSVIGRPDDFPAPASSGTVRPLRLSFACDEPLSSAAPPHVVQALLHES